MQVHSVPDLEHVEMVFCNSVYQWKNGRVQFRDEFEKSVASSPLLKGFNAVMLGHSVLLRTK